MPFHFYTTDFAAEELVEPDFKSLGKRGLKVKPLAPEALLKIDALSKKYPVPSFTDLSCLVLAEEINCKLLTGDQALRKAAKNENNIVVHGVLWLLDQLVDCQILTPREAASKLKEILQMGARLPITACEERFHRWNT